VFRDGACIIIKSTTAPWQTPASSLQRPALQSLPSVAVRVFFSSRFRFHPNMFRHFSCDRSLCLIVKGIVRSRFGATKVLAPPRLFSAMDATPRAVGIDQVLDSFIDEPALQTRALSRNLAKFAKSTVIRATFLEGVAKQVVKGL